MAVVDKTDIFPWSENFATGVEIIDVQHRKLVELVNLLADHLAYQSDIPTISALFDELADYALYHFETEEQVWHYYLCDDDAFPQHLSAHQDFIDKIELLKSDHQHKNFSKTVEEILSFLTQWLAFHILDSDKRMAITIQAIEAGMTLEEAKIKADAEMNGGIEVLIKTILSMYDNLSCRTINLMKEINKRRKLEKKLRLAANVIQNTLDGICVTDEQLAIIEVNPAFSQSCGCNGNSAVGQPLRAYKSGLNDPALYEVIERTVLQQGHWSGEVKSHNAMGELESEWLTLSVMRDEDNSISNFIAVFSNVRQLLKRQHSLEKAANHDALTGLPNRMLLKDRLEFAMVRCDRAGCLLAVCYLDLDGFKPINDRFGHAAGDRLLCEIARRFQHVLRDNDTVARIGGDEFVILLENLGSLDDCQIMATRLVHEVSHPLVLEGESVQVTASLGIAVYPHQASTAQQLIHQADRAMYRAKNAGKAQYRFAEL